MTARGIFGFLFVLYCVEAGTLLVMAPWSGYWERLVAGLPVIELQLLALRPWVRGAVTGFGLVHLIWGAHDLDAWLNSLRRVCLAVITPPPPPSWKSRIRATCPMGLSSMGAPPEDTRYGKGLDTYPRRCR